MEDDRPRKRLTLEMIFQDETSLGHGKDWREYESQYGLTLHTSQADGKSVPASTSIGTSAT